MPAPARLSQILKKTDMERVLLSAKDAAGWARSRQE
jgi:hypothetical protein